jgi:hypothetical protein
LDTSFKHKMWVLGPYPWVHIQIIRQVMLNRILIKRESHALLLGGHWRMTTVVPSSSTILIAWVFSLQ